MLETIRRYWIGLLVLVLVGLHASIVGVIRHQASLAKIDASCEVDLGEYLAYQPGIKPPLQMRLHAIVPLNHRMKSRQLIELNQAQIRQSIEEYLRQLDSKCLVDPYLADLKSQLMEVMIQTIGDSSIDDLVITEVRQALDAVSLEFLAQGKNHQPRRMVASLRSQSGSQDDSNGSHSDAGHGTEEGGPEHGEPAEGDSTASDQPRASKSNPAPAKKATSHATPAKKPDAKPASGHGADKKKDVKKSGH